MTSGTVDQTLIMQEIRKRTLFSKIREKTYLFKMKRLYMQENPQHYSYSIVVGIANIHQIYLIEIKLLINRSQNLYSANLGMQKDESYTET